MRIHPNLHFQKSSHTFLLFCVLCRFADISDNSAVGQDMRHSMTSHLLYYEATGIDRAFYSIRHNLNMRRDVKNEPAIVRLSVVLSCASFYALFYPSFYLSSYPYAKLKAPCYRYLLIKKYCYYYVDKKYIKKDKKLTQAGISPIRRFT